MARRCVRATSRLTFCFSEKSTLSSWTCLFGAFVLFGAAAEAELYTSSDQVTLLTPENVKSVLVNSSAATVVEFYAAWCGHCIAFSPIYKSLARDIKEWKPAVDVAAFHCMGEENVRVCAAYNVTGFPTVKFFHAYSTPDAVGVAFKGHDVTSLRRRIIDKLETHKEPGPPACPPLEPTSQAEVSSFFETNTSQYLALVFEKPDSYLGRELTLDLLQFENISVRRVLSTEQGLVAELGVTQFPSCYLYHPGGNFTRLEVKAEARTFYFYALQRLPGVVRSGKPPVVIDVHNNKTQEPWRPFNSSRVYMADLESTLHYSLRVELAAHTVIKGRALNPLKNYIGVLAKYFPGRPIVMNTLNSLNSWLQNQSQDEILYKDFKEILDNTAQSPDTALPRGERWVACQGSQLHFRRYPCGMWTLFHVLTVEAKKAEASNQLEVPLAMRNYIHAFFGCRYCAEHFDNLVRGSLLENEAVLWLWSIHNEVNSRLSGALSEDPNFPKIQWPSPDMCPECHNVTKRGEHRWNKDKALRFLLFYFSSNRILPDYLEDETQILAKQREEHAGRLLALEAEKKAERRVREAPDLEIQPLPSNPTVQEEEEEEEEEEGEEPQDEAVAEGEEEEGGEGAVAAQESNPWDKPEMAGGERSQKVRRKPSIVGMKIRRNMEDHIVDLDLFENQHFKAKALQLAASSRIKRRSLQRKVEPEPGPVFGLGMELDGGVGMVGLQPVDADFDMDVGQQRKWLQKRDLSPTGHWMSTLSIGFSRVDVSLCVLLYFLSCMCLLGMYTFFQHRFRLRRVKFSMS